MAVAHYSWHIDDLSSRDHEVPIGEGGGPVHELASTNNVAEWCGLIAGLLWLRDLARKPQRLSIEGDSQLVIYQLQKRWKCKQHHLARLRDRALDLLLSLGVEWTASWVPREENRRADAICRTISQEARNRGIIGHVRPDA